MSEQLRWGIMGPGKITLTILSDFRLAKIRFDAVGSRSIDRANAYAQANSIPKAYGSYQELVSDPDLDVIYIATTHNAHFENAMLALGAGKNVLLEKPFTLDANQAKQLAALAKEKDVFLMEAMWTRFLPNHVAIFEKIKEGLIGGAGIDVFPVEPEKNGDAFTTPLQGLPNVILTPHIGGSTEEAQQNIGEDVSIKLFQYLERGITNGSHSVPSIALPPVEGAHRILHMHNNVPGVLSAINTALSKNNINIVGQYLKTNEDIGYVVLDVDTKLSKRALELLKEVKDTIKVRMLY